MTTRQIYSTYQTPPSLQDHMLKVSSLVSIILNNWIGERVSKDDIITCALFHDIAKPVTFDPSKQKQYVKSEKELNEVLLLIKDMTTKYGTDEHQVAIEIFKEINCNENTIRLIDNLEWIYLPRLFKENGIEALLLNYVDMRIGPKGIISLQERFDELKNRDPFKGIDEVALLSDKLETIIQENTEVRLDQISNEDIDSNLEKLLNRHHEQN